jgi:hypothetical protein
MRRAVRAVVVKDDALFVIRPNKFGEEYYTLVSGEPTLPLESTEVKNHALVTNLYGVVWPPTSKLADVPLVSETLKKILVNAFTKGFPMQPQTIVPQQGVIA